MVVEWCTVDFVYISSSCFTHGAKTAHQNKRSQGAWYPSISDFFTLECIKEGQLALCLRKTFSWLHWCHHLKLQNDCGFRKTMCSRHTVLNFDREPITSTLTTRFITRQADVPRTIPAMFCYIILTAISSIYAVKRLKEIREWKIIATKINKQVRYMTCYKNYFLVEAQPEFLQRSSLAQQQRGRSKGASDGANQVCHKIPAAIICAYANLACQHSLRHNAESADAIIVIHQLKVPHKLWTNLFP